jgi:hypothetical protein
VVVELAGQGHDPIPFEIHLGCLIDVAVVRPCVDREREGGAVREQAGDGLGLDHVVDHGDEEAAGGRAGADEDGGAVPEREVAVLGQLDVEAPLGDELADDRASVADDDDDPLQPRAAEGRYRALEECDAGHAGERLRQPAEARARSRREDDAHGYAEEGLRRTGDHLRLRRKAALRLRYALDGRHAVCPGRRVPARLSSPKLNCFAGRVRLYGRSHPERNA